MNLINLLKYEIVIKYKRALFFICLLTAWMVYLFTRINAWPDGGAAVVACVTAVGILVGILVSSIRILHRELNDDTGYMLYSLPVKGYDIVGAKVIAIIIEYIIYTLIFATELWIIFINTINKSGMGIFNKLITNNFQYVIYFYVNILVFIIGVSLLAYLSMLAARMFLYKRKYERLASIGIFFGAAYVISEIISIFTSNLGFNKIDLNQEIMSIDSGFKIYLQGPALQTSIIGMVVSIVIVAAMFFLASYVTENHLEL